jgi:hypothetical protein
MSLIVDIPADISVSILCEWLQVKNLIEIDSAICNKVNRVLFLNIVQHEPLKYKEELSITVSGSMKWLLVPHFIVFRLNLVQKSWDFISLDSLKVIFFSKFKSLNVVEGLESHRSKFLELISVTKSLTYINFEKCPLVDDKIISAIANNCVQLNTFLCLSEGFINDKVHDKSIVQLTKQCIFLEVLQVGNCIELTDYIGVAISENCSELRNLSFCYLPKLTDKTIDALTNPKSNCKGITDLYIQKCLLFTLNGINQFFIPLKHLVNITIIMHPRPPRSYSNYGYAFLPFHSCKLMSVRLVGYRVSFNLLRGMKREHINLRELMLIGDDRNNLTDNPDGYKHVAQCCHNLELLTLEKCSELSEEHLIAILEISGKTLSFLSISPQFSISSATIDAIVNYCSGLTTLKMSGVSFYSDLIEIVLSCQLLVSLDLSRGCSFDATFNWVDFTSAIIESKHMKNVYFCKGLLNKEEVKVLKQNFENNVIFM